MTLLHYSKSHLTAVFSVTLQKPNWKPSGLWVSVLGDDDWLSWCQSEEFATDCRISTEVVLRDTANVIRIDDVMTFDAFETAYGLPGDFPSDRKIDWPSVASKYQGIIIAPYIWKRRLTALWYYGWDCASGCIWDADAIESLIPL